MKKFLSLLALLLTYSGTTWAAACATYPAANGTCGPVTSYVVTISEIALCQDAACTAPTVVGSGVKSFDIGSVAVGATIGSYADFGSVPAGTYNYMRSVISSSFSITAAAITATNGTCPAISSTTLSVPNGLDPAIPVDALALAAIPGVTWNDPLGKTKIQVITTLASPLVIPATGNRPSLSMSFGTTSALLCANMAPGVVAAFPLSPEIILTVSP